jgi:hypothetical protein
MFSWPPPPRLLARVGLALVLVGGACRLLVAAHAYSQTGSHGLKGIAPQKNLCWKIKLSTVEIIFIQGVGKNPGFIFLKNQPGGFFWVLLEFFGFYWVF